MLREPTAEDPGESGLSITLHGSVSDSDARAALGLAAAAADADGVAPLSEEATLHLRYGGDPAASNLFLRSGPELAGFAHLGPAGPAGERSGELVVHPAHRRRGYGRALTRAMLEQAAGAPVLVWAHGDLPAATRLAAASGFTRVRGLWQMRRPLDIPVGDPVVPAGMTIRTFRPGRDEEEWLSLNARAFADHPEQGRWTRQDLDRREREPWFDPAGFFLAERDGTLAGFHWTKLHAGGGAVEAGEVYVVGTDPGARGGGLARALTVAGLRYLRERGAPEVMLYVDDSNVPAIGLYRSLGFHEAGIDVMYRHG